MRIPRTNRILCPNGVEIHLIALNDDSAWDQCRFSVKHLSQTVPSNPWSGWLHIHQARTLGFPKAPFWLMEMRRKSDLIAIGVFREEHSRRRYGTLKILRSLDWMAATYPPILVSDENRPEAYNALASALAQIGKASDCDQLCFGQLDHQNRRQWTEALHKAGVTYRDRLLTYDQVLDLTCWFEQSNVKKKRHNMQRMERKLAEHSGLSPVFERFRGDVFQQLKDNGLWRQFLDLWRSSWQTQSQSQHGQAPIAQGFQYVEQSAKEWSRLGQLDFCAYRLGDQLLSCYFNVAIDGYLWLLMTYYGTEFEQYGIGTNNLMHMILDSHDRGDRTLDFGGEGVLWKRRWSTHERPVHMLEVPLAGWKARLFSLQQQLQRFRPSHFEPVHAIQSRQDFEASTGTGKTTTAKSTAHATPDIQVTPLQSENDWQDIRKEFIQLENSSFSTPWSSWEHSFTLWKHFFPNQRCWVIRIPMPEGRPSGLLAAAIFLEEQVTRRGISFTTLRSLDQMTMRLPAFPMRQGLEDMACRKMTDALPRIAEITQTDLIGLYRQDENNANRWLQELHARQHFVQSRIFTVSQLIQFPETFEEYEQNLQREHKNLIKNIKRSERKIEKDFHSRFEFQHVSGKTFSDPDFQELFEKFEQLRKNSWQIEEATKTGFSDPKLVAAYFREAAEHWAQKSELDLFLLSIEGKPVATYLGLIRKANAYALLTAYDRDYHRYGVGQFTFYNWLKRLHEIGIRNVELGGEGSSWKKSWAQQEDALYQIEIPLPSPKGWLWQAMQRIKKSHGHQPVR